jgi:hypothetical protein
MKTSLLRATLMIAGCTGLMGWSQPGQAQSYPPPPPGNTPKARVCQMAGGQMQAKVAPPKTMTVSNEGGWCNDYRFAGGGVPFQIVSQPQHGELQMRVDNGWKIISYRPTQRYTGPDGFELVWVNPNIHMVYTVNVTP